MGEIKIQNMKKIILVSCLLAICANSAISQSIIGTWNRREYDRAADSESSFSYTFSSDKTGVYCSYVRNNGLTTRSYCTYFKWKKVGNTISYGIYRIQTLDANGIDTKEYKITKYDMKVVVTFEGNQMKIVGQGWGDGLYSH
jgi:hypothetical protein